MTSPGPLRSAMRAWLGLATLLLPAPSTAQERAWDWGMHPMWGFWGVWGLAMMLAVIVFWALVIAGLVLGLRWLLGQARGAGQDSALQILRERYARGEISHEEFEAKKRDLAA